MKGGDIVLMPLPQADGLLKNRPVLALCAMRPFNDRLVCGISTQLHQAIADFDEVVASDAADFSPSGLAAPSLIRLGFLATVPLAKIKGRIGNIAHARYSRLLLRLAKHFDSLGRA